MRVDTRSRRAPALIAFLLSAAAPALAQEVAPLPTPSADKLAEEMRVLAREPRNVRALLSAGELSARLNDPAAAAGFFARAQALDRNNPRVQAGQAMVMVRKERPGEALRLFADAERRGLSMDAYASDRGLAYDLIGAQAHAQRDHRIAMRNNPDDETIRRYALSLGISGRSDEAMKVLDPLLRRSDRAGWRARAFILAMNGDAAGADKIAASMMGGAGTALAPFFRRLPSLSAADKAFAVHFGELRRTTARIADAQLAPPLPRLAREPGVAMAAVEISRSTPAPATGATSRDTGRGGDRQVREELAAGQAEARRIAQETQRRAELKARQEREALAAKQREAERLAAEQRARETEARRVAEAQARERTAAELAAREREAQRVAAAPQPAPASEPAPAPGFETTPATTASASDPAPARTADAVPATPRIGGEDNVIARIIAGITIPASELGVQPMPGREPPAAAPAGTAPVELARVETPKTTLPAAQPKPERVKPEPARTLSRDKPAEPEATAPAKAAKGKAAAKPKPKPKPKPDPVKTDPARHWVQVAGGANAGDLDRAWRKLVDKAPAEFRGKRAWTTPLRFTNRLLAGPFKSAGAAQDFVNALAKKDISAFAWTSEAGQKIEKLATK